MTSHFIRLSKFCIARGLQGALVSLALCCTLAAPSAQERPARLALFIGNANYPDGGRPLTTPVNDARALAETFRRLDFDTTVKENLGKQDLRGAIDAFVSSVRPGSLALIYFAGYGLQAGNQTYLMPVDANIWQEADIQREAISLETVVAQLHDKGARSRIVIVDAAYRNPFERRFRNVPAGLATLGGPVGTLAIYSSAPGTRVAEPTGTSSTFADELIKALRTPDRLAETIFNETRTGVSRATKGEQVPWVASSLLEEVRVARVAPPPEPAQPAPAPATAAPGPAAPAMPAPPPVSAAKTPAPTPPTVAASPPPPAAMAKAAPPAAKAAPPAPAAPSAAPATAAPTPAPSQPGSTEQPAPPEQAPSTVATTTRPDASEKSLSAREVFQKHKLFGVFAWDCGRPPSSRNWYTMHRPIGGNRVEQAILTRLGRPSVTVFDTASEATDNTILVNGKRGKQAVSGSWQVDGRRLREVEAAADGKPEIIDGKWVDGGRAIAWSRKCSP